jgi:hypothetical protein
VLRPGRGLLQQRDHLGHLLRQRHVLWYLAESGVLRSDRDLRGHRRQRHLLSDWADLWIGVLCRRRDL